MPGHAGSPYWTAVDFDSEEDEDSTSSPNSRLYLDPWDNQAYGMVHESAESSHGDTFNNSLGEPVSASFYYVPTKNYESDEDTKPPPVRRSNPEIRAVAGYTMHSRQMALRSAVVPDYQHPDISIYGERPIENRRRSMFIEEQIYDAHHRLYEPMYGQIVPPPPPGYLAPRPRCRVSLPQHSEYTMAALPNSKPRRHSSRMTDAYEQCAYESLSPEYEDWARPFPKAVPENFHLSRYGHLQIDYTCSWNSLDRLIRNK